MAYPRRVYLYGFNEVWRIADTRFLEEDAISITNMLKMVERMMEYKPDIRMVVAVDNRGGLYQDYMKSVRSSDYTDWYEFADLVANEGFVFS
jgi:hypothetical protein